MMQGKTKKLAQTGILIAIQIVLSRFLSISTPVTKIGFGFAPIAAAGMLCGPLWGAVTGALSDILGATLFPIGAYFPGFTLSAALTGAVFGFFLSRGKGILSAAAAVLINCLIINLALNTFWLTIITGTDFQALLATRIVSNAVMIPVQLTVLILMRRTVLIYKGYASL